ncbi:MAG: hypothetical protein NUV99_04240 [Clostridia bacterium]|nr:hypothetical protein [Clostridia bacterium]
MARAAEEFGLRFIVFADHARRNSTYVERYCFALETLRASCKCVAIKTGLEVKFLNAEGVVDCKPEWIPLLNCLIVSFHSFPQEAFMVHGKQAFKSIWFRTVQRFGEKEVPLLRTLNPDLELVLGHPFSMWKRWGLEPGQEEIADLVAIANSYGFALEINVNPKHFPGFDYATIVPRMCHRYTYGSDAHSVEELRVLAPRILAMQHLGRVGGELGAEGPGGNRNPL